MKVARNGQITLPKNIREELGIHEGCEVRAEIKDNTIVIRKKGYDWENHETIFTDELISKLNNINKEIDTSYWEKHA